MSLLKSHWKDIFYFILAKVNKKYNTNIEVSFWGNLTKETDYDERDFILSANTIKELPFRRHTYIYLFDQGSEWRTRNWCVVINWYLWVCNNVWITPTYKEIHEWLDYFESKNVWWEDKGAVIPTIVKEGQKRWNKLHPEDKLIYFRMNYKDPEFKEAIEKGYELLWGRYTFSEYSEDKANAKIEYANYAWWKKKWGHCLNIMEWSSLNNSTINEVTKAEVMNARNFGEVFHEDSTYAVNSYPTTQKDYNIYEHDLLSEHCKNGIWFPWFYLTVAENDLNAPVEDIKQETISIKEKEKQELRDKFKVSSRYGHLIAEQDCTLEDLVFNNFKEEWFATIADVKELIQYYHNKHK